MTIERLRLGLDRVAEAIERLNDLGREVGLPPLAIRCCGSKMLHGQIAAESFLLDLTNAHLLECLDVMLQDQERLAA